MELPELIANHIKANITLANMNVELFANIYPDDPNTIISVIDSGGFPPNRYSPVREKIFDIKIRTQNYSNGIELGNQIFNLFHSKNKYNLGDFFILSSYAYTELSWLYLDNRDRDQFSLELVFQYQY